MFCRADCERRERQRKMKNDEAQPSRRLRARSFSAPSNRRSGRTCPRSAATNQQAGL